MPCVGRGQNLRNLPEVRDCGMASLTSLPYAGLSPVNPKRRVKNNYRGKHVINSEPHNRNNDGNNLMWDVTAVSVPPARVGLPLLFSVPGRQTQPRMFPAQSANLLTPQPALTE